MNQDQKANRLISSTSPYLLQHAYNPVEWYPWGQEALDRAREEGKVILVSIGYSSCHWCHVMERESFENDSIASVMNEHFINIKVDREERPDIDQIYMDAVQTMGINGGWPLNVFLTPDQKPFYGGTYFPPDRWPKLLDSIAHSFKEQRDEIIKSAEDIAKSLNRSEVEKFRLQFDNDTFELETLDDAVKKLSTTFDHTNGGFKRAPKFPLPSDWQFLLNYSKAKGDIDTQTHTLFTLEKMAQGGIYDQMGGGFARYSTDEEWFAPHFEKMLYDNGQLLKLYSEAYKVSGKESFKKVVYQTIDWLQREMMSEEGGFYSAMDADSEGVEGKYYVWKAGHLQELIADDYDWYSNFYGIKESGNWENGNNILFMTQDEFQFARSRNIDPVEFGNKLDEWNRTLLQIRNNRVAPGLDDKILTGWNALTTTGLITAYHAFDEPNFLHLALKNGEFILERMMEENRLFRCHKDGKSHIPAYLEDYAFTIEAFHSLYEATWDEKWIQLASELAEYTIANFFDENEKLFFYTSASSEELIARKKEIFDNVIPSSNSQMAINLHKLGLVLDRSDYSKISEEMLRQVTQLAKQEPSYMSNWASLYIMKSYPTAEIIIVGDQYREYAKEFRKVFLPNSIIMATTDNSNLPLFENRVAKEGITTVYVCFDKACKLPVTSVEEAMDQIN